MDLIILILLGIFVGIIAAFTGLGGGFLVVPFLLLLGHSADRAVGTSFLVILLIAISAIIAHNRVQNIDYKIGVFLGVGGIVGAQIGAQLIEFIPTDTFKKVFAGILVLIAMRLAL